MLMQFYRERTETAGRKILTGTTNDTNKMKMKRRKLILKKRGRKLKTKKQKIWNGRNTRREWLKRVGFEG